MKEAKTRFGEFLDIAQRGPVRESAEDNEAMRAVCADRLLKTMDETADAAEKAGMTSEILEQLLADEI